MNAHRVRKAAFAGSWYPAQASECERQIESFVEQSLSRIDRRMNPVGGVVPHAGWYYSGAIACRVFHHLSQARAFDPDVFLVFGMHLNSNSPSYIMTDGAWETPLGNIEVDRDLAQRLASAHGSIIETPTDFTPDNTIELQLPFIKYFFENAKIVAMGVPPDSVALDIGVAAVEAAMALGRRVMIIGSTDLTHYGANYGFTSRGSAKKALTWVQEENDRLVIDAILEMNPENVIQVARINQNACCAGAVAAAVASAKQLGANQSEPVAYATSYEKSPGDSFVGYVGVVFGIE